MTKVRKPFYKKWWFILLVAIFILGAIGSALESEEEKEERAAEEQAKKIARELEMETENPAPEEESSEDEAEDKEKSIELKKELAFPDFKVIINKVIIKDNILTIPFDWENQSDWDLAHFELVGYVQVEQSGKVLKDVSSDRKYKQIKRNRFDQYDLEYELLDDSEVTIKVVNVSEFGDSEEVIKVEIN